MDDEFEVAGLDAKWTTRNLNSTTWTSKKGSMTATGNTSGAGNNPSFITQPITSNTSAWEFAVKISNVYHGSHDSDGGLYVGNSSGKGWVMSRYNSGGSGFYINTFTAYGVGSSNIFLPANETGIVTANFFATPTYYAIAYDGGGNLTFKISYDGILYANVFSVATTFLGSAPDTVGVMFSADNTICAASFDWFRRIL
jgi:hypothetical protein